jgi:GTP pyrophosphokinase
MTEEEKKIVNKIKDYVLSIQPDFDIMLLDKAVDFMLKANENKKRLSGAGYSFHSISVAEIIAFEMKLDPISIISAYLHDSLEEDSSITIELIENEFGKEISEIVDGVLNLTNTKYKSKNEQRAASFRKMIQISTLKDIRVIFVKLADRLHNMRTLKYLSKEKQLTKAKETSELYAPIAHKLGLYNIKSELEDLSFKFLDNENYLKIAQLLGEKKTERDEFIDHTLKDLNALLTKVNVNGKVLGRAKHIYSIYEKMKKSNKNFDDLFDLTAFRIIVDKIEECYLVLGVIHSQYKALPGRFKDYISLPKPNGYQSLHTAVISPQGKKIEIQIRTEEMNLIAENGLAAHWAYKEGPQKSSILKEQEKINKLKKIVKYWLEDEFDNPQEATESLTNDLIEIEEIYVFTPGGDVVILPSGATLLDFAYNIHSDLGNHCTGGTVNGQIASLKQVLRSGQIISVTKSSNQKPKVEWLDFVVSYKARSKISYSINKDERDKAKEKGKELLERECAKLGLNLTKLNKDNKVEDKLRNSKYSSLSQFLILIGYGKLDPKEAVSKILPEEKKDVFNQEEIRKEEEHKFANFLKKFTKSATIHTKSGVVIDGIDNIQIKFAKCCNPIPNEDIIGYISMGVGVTVHKKSCNNIKNFDEDRFLDAYWSKAGYSRPIIVVVNATNKVGLLSNVTKVLSKMDINIENITASKDTSGVVEILMTLSIKDVDILKKIKNKLIKIPGITNIEFKRNINE